jgi:hypothetical protein
MMENIYNFQDNPGNLEDYQPKRNNIYAERGGFVNQIFNELFDYDNDNTQTNTQVDSMGKDNTSNPDFEKERAQFLREKKKFKDEQKRAEAMGIATSPWQYDKGRELNDLQSKYGIPIVGGQSGDVNPNLAKTQEDVSKQFNVTNLGIWGDKSHQARKSDHNTGDAQDFGFDTPETANSLVQKLQSEAGDRKIKYIIYNGKIWNPSVSEEWRPYRGSNPHSTHIHVSYNR